MFNSENIKLIDSSITWKLIFLILIISRIIDISFLNWLPLLDVICILTNWYIKFINILIYLFEYYF